MDDARAVLPGAGMAVPIAPEALAVLRHLRGLVVAAQTELAIAERNFQAYASTVVGGAGIAAATVDLERGIMTEGAPPPAAGQRERNGA